MLYHYNQETIKFSPYTSIIMQPNKVPHVMAFWKITYVINGSGVQITDGISRTLKQNSILIIKPGSTHQNYSFSDPNYQHRDIYISDEDMRLFCSYLPKNPYDKLCKQTAFFKVSLLSIENLEQTLNLFPVNSTIKNNYLSSLHTAVVINILALFLEHNSKSLTKPTWITELENKANNTDCLQNNVSYLIKGIPYSHTHICREFKKYNKITLTDFLTRAKIVYANILLMDKKNSIADIAYFLGFATQSSFIKSYKKYYQISPGAFRKKNLLNKNSSTTTLWGERVKK